MSNKPTNHILVTGRVLQPVTGRRADELIELVTKNAFFFENYIFKKQVLIRKLKRKIEVGAEVERRKLYTTCMDLVIQASKYLAAKNGYDWQKEFDIGVRQEASMKLFNFLVTDDRW